METKIYELDAQLIEQFSALGTSDKDELIRQMKSIVGAVTSDETCAFFLELAGWNVSKAVGAYFDFSFENETVPQNMNCSTLATVHTHKNINPLISRAYDVRVIPDPNYSNGSPFMFKVIVENCGQSPWPDGAYIRSETYTSRAVSATVNQLTNQIAWLPIGTDRRISLPPELPSQSVELVITPDCPQLFTDAVERVVGALSFCLPSGEVFGETLYCTALLDATNQTWLYRRGIPDVHNFAADDSIPMDEF